MDLSQIESPMDLILENEKPAKPIEKIQSQIKHCNPAELLELSKDLTQLLLEFHEYVIEKKEGEVNPQWFVDAQSLSYAIKILETIDL